MSRLIDKLNKTNKSAAQPMGFRTSRSEEEEASLIIIASADTDAPDKIGEYTAGADAVYLTAQGAGLSAETVKDIIKALAVPCGMDAKAAGKKKPDDFIKAGGDFLVLPAESPVELIPEDEKTGKLLRIDPGIEDSLARVINNLPVDAVITTEITGKEKTITWQHLMNIQRLAMLITKPVIIPVAASVTSRELKAIRDADIGGILVAADAGEPGRIERIRRDIKGLPPRSEKKRGKSDVLLPHSAGPTEAEIPEEDDDDY